MRRIYNHFLKLGIIGFLVCIVYKIYYKLLSLFFGFERWHASSSFYCRPYKNEVVKVINNYNYKSVMEIGCGLGEIISRVSCNECYGVDRDYKVIKAANYLSTNSALKYYTKELGDICSLTDLNIKSIDVLVMVNWPHGLKWNDLSSAVKEIVNTFNVSLIVIDGIDANVTGYANYYNEGNFSEWGDVEKILPLSDGVRSLYCIKVN